MNLFSSRFQRAGIESRKRSHFGVSLLFCQIRSLAMRRLGQALICVCPSLLARFAVKVFMTPQHYPRPFWERELLKRGRPLPLSSGRSAFLWGQSGPIILLVHGWEGRGTQLGKWVDPLLEKGFRVVAWDAPAHGDSPGKEVHIVRFAKALAEDVLEIGPLAGLVAHSLGAAATVFALSRQWLSCQRVVLVASPASILTVVQGYLRRIQMPERAQAAFQKFLQKKVGVTFQEVEISELARQISLPVFIIHDMGDLEVPYTDSKKLVKNWPEALHLKVEGLGHRKILKDPVVIQKALIFLS